MAPHVSGHRNLPPEEDTQNPIQFFPSENADGELEDGGLPVLDEPLEQPGPIILKRSSEERDWPPEITFPRSLLFLVFAVAVGAITVGLVSLLQGRRPTSTTTAVNAPRPTASSETAPAGERGNQDSAAPAASGGISPDGAAPGRLAPDRMFADSTIPKSLARGDSRIMDAARLPGETAPNMVSSGSTTAGSVSSLGVSSSSAAIFDRDSAPDFETPLEGLPELPLTTAVDLPRPQPPAPVAPPQPAAVSLGTAGQSPSPRQLATPVLDDREAIEQLLVNYRDAYRRLDAASAASLFPRVDTRALNRAFSTIVQQEMRFERCSLKLDDQQASALCIGEMEYVPRTGDQSPRTQSLTWAFEFARRSDRWEISNIDAR